MTNVLSEQVPEQMIDQYVHWLEKVRPENTKRIASFVADDVRYHTPVLEAAGPQNIVSVFADTYMTVPNVRFKVLQRVQNDELRTVFLRWDCLRDDGNISGMTEMMIDMKGKIIALTDYWDRTVEKPEPSLIQRIFKR